VGEQPHPRGWGTFPRFLGRYARELGILSLEEAVMHATSRAAVRLGLADRGVVAEGAWADLVVLDPECVGSAATYTRPKVPPMGIGDVFVNGKPVRRDGNRTKLSPGVGVRRRWVPAEAPFVEREVATELVALLVPKDSDFLAELRLDVGVDARNANMPPRTRPPA